MLIATLTAVLAVLSTVWVMRGPDSYGDSSTGCIHVSLPSSTGGYIVDECGSSARVWCAAQPGTTGVFAERARRACRDAGYDPIPAGG